jgi:hypothetical protein
VQEVIDGLRETDGIAFDAQRPVGNDDSQGLVARSGRQRRGVEGISEKFHQTDLALDHAKRTLADAGSIHQIVSQSGDCIDLAFHSLDHPDDVGLIG